jgi:hypothetical protein
MPTGMMTMPANISTKADVPVHAGSEITGWKKFMPKKPTTKERGMNNVVMTVGADLPVSRAI